MARSQVPKFGNWESEEDVPYTVYFDNARKGKIGAKMNPNDPQDYADAELKGQKGPEVTKPKHRRRSSREDDDLRSPMDSPLHSDAMSQKSTNEVSHHRQGGSRYVSAKSIESEGARGPETIRVRHERQQSREDGDLRRPTDSPLRSEAAHRRPTHDSPHHRHGGLSAGETPRKISRQGAGSDRSIDNSPLHPQFQAKTSGRGTGVSSPSWDRKSSLEGGPGMAPLTPGRSRLRSVTRGDDTPDHSAAVPKFGDWDETDPSSAEGYTHIFNKVREEKESGAGKVPSMSDKNDANGQKRIGRDNSKGWGCFSCLGR